MISRREWIAFALAFLVTVLSGNLPLGIVTFLAAWMVQIEKPDNSTPEKRYWQRERKRRNRT